MVNNPKTEALETRTSLPEPLRVLLETYPREAWSADPAFSELIRFWIDRHQMFRKLLQIMQSETESVLDNDMDAQTFAAHLSRYGSMFVGELHGHHSIEDHHYFPKIKGLEARIAHGFDILDRDHHALDGHLSSFAETANGLITAVAEGQSVNDAAGTLRDGLSDMERFLNRHLTDEEELVVPVLLKHGSGTWT